MIRRRLGPASLLCLGLLPTLVVAVGVGAVEIPPVEVLRILGRGLGLPLAPPPDAAHELVLWTLRLPRVGLAALVGGSLGLSGALMQGLFRNPLADPGLIGVSTGAGFAAALVLVFGAPAVGWASALVLPLAAFAGGLLVTIGVARLALVDGIVSVPTMLLAGIAANALASAGTGALVLVADDAALRGINFWMLGSLGGASWPMVTVAAAVTALTSAVAWRARPMLDALMLGEAEARHLGVDVERTKRALVATVALAVGASVAMCGVIGFIGLVVPHLVRLAGGPLHHNVLAGSMLGGALLLVLADLGARTVIAPAELPVGLVTTGVGGPFFLWLLARQRQGVR